MAETQMNVRLLAHTRLDWDFYEENMTAGFGDAVFDATSGKAVALTAIRTCYSPLKPSEIVATEGHKYFNVEATDGNGGKESDRLFRHIIKSGHTSTLEHLTYTFAIEGVSRSLLAQLTRHRVGFSFSVQSQRYVKLGTNDKSGGFDYVVPESIKRRGLCLSQGFCVHDGPCTDECNDTTAEDFFNQLMYDIQQAYDLLRSVGIPAEDARAVLPNATATNLTMTSNLRALLDFYGKRRKGNGAQAEIAQLAEELRKAVVAVEPWTEQFFEGA